MDSKTLERFDSGAGLREQFETLWRRKWLVVGIAFLGALLSGTAVLFVPKKYEASVVLMPLSDSGSTPQIGGGLGSLASEFGGLASLAGLAIGDGSRKAESVAVLQSEILTEAYIQQNNLLPVLFEKDWDSNTNGWKKLPPNKMPTPWKGNQVFKKDIRQVSTNSKNGLVTLTITWTDPVLAAKWANELVKSTNDYMRNRAIRESERDISYLGAEAARTTIVEARQAIYSLMQNEINKQMVARGREDYALKVLDPAVPAERAASPEKVVWVLVGAFIGGLLSAGYVLVRADRN
jgi:uncharacterized protein involved in exopolysaccharide biosynthesis